MKALSLTRPWPYTILHMGKRIENRSDKRGMPPMCRYRGPLLLHAAKSWDKIANWCARRGLFGDGAVVSSTKPSRFDFAALADRGRHPTGIVGRCRVVGHLTPSRKGDGIPRYHIEGIDDGEPLDLRWWMGGYGLILADVEALDEPIPCKGRLGLWTPPEEVLEKLPEGWAA